MKTKFRIFSKKNTFFCVFVISASIAGGTLFNLPRIRALSESNRTTKTEETKKVDWEARFDLIDDEDVELSEEEFMILAEEVDRRAREAYYDRKSRFQPISDSERRQYFREVAEEVREMKRDLRRVGGLDGDPNSVGVQLRDEIRRYESDVRKRKNFPVGTDSVR